MGTCGKPGLDIDVVNYIRHLVMTSYPPMVGEDAAKLWQECINATNGAISDNKN